VVRLIRLIRIVKLYKNANAALIKESESILEENQVKPASNSIVNGPDSSQDKADNNSFIKQMVPVSSHDT
jgi:hypothetical protein